MDAQLEYTKRHYDSHSNKHSDQRAAKRQRQSGPAYELKIFHNRIKRLLLKRFAFRCERLLDLCCGRGGDINKWIDSGVKYVLGIDLSPEEIKEAGSRFEQLAPGRRRGLKCDFRASDDLGRRPVELGEPFDVVTCMFALHYFCVEPGALRTFVGNVSHNLKAGGRFIATFPDGKQILKCLNQQDELDMPLFKLKKKWEGPPQCFGSAYTFAISDTVTHGENVTAGSFEYLVFFKVLTQIAKEHSLVPICVYDDDELDHCFMEEDRKLPFKHFNPRFDGTREEYRSSLLTASACNIAVVFSKVEENERSSGLSSPRGGDDGRGSSKEPTYAWDSDDETFSF